MSVLVILIEWFKVDGKLRNMYHHLFCPECDFCKFSKQAHMVWDNFTLIFLFPDFFLFLTTV